MESTSIVALSSQAALRRQMDIVAHNIANMNTTAFKAEKMMFIEHVVKSQGGERIFGDQVTYVRDIATVRDVSEGSLIKTGNQLDLAIRGQGYFVVETEFGERYTRNGRFRLDDTGQLVNNEGFPLPSEGGQPFFLSPEDNEVTISRDGTLSTENGELGRVRVVGFENDQELEALADGLYTTNADPDDVERPEVVQGMLESSNVNAIIELARMIEVHRAYDAVKHLMDREDDRLQKVAREIAANEAA